MVEKVYQNEITNEKYLFNHSPYVVLSDDESAAYQF